MQHIMYAVSWDTQGFRNFAHLLRSIIIPYIFSIFSGRPTQQGEKNVQRHLCTYGHYKSFQNTYKPFWSMVQIIRNVY